MKSSRLLTRGRRRMPMVRNNGLSLGLNKPIPSFNNTSWNIVPVSRTGTSMTNEIIAQQWMEKVAPPTRYGTVYGMPNRACSQFPSFLQGVGTTSEGAVDPKEYQEMKLKVSQLTSTLSSTRGKDVAYASPN
ncbi:uncharacterized protein LOC132060878 [Lycium ferocissimum]|uniref:uncharacterized protein LOC132060878 n=1 Tax=Lycium ferocissimum TaxID=112874 RepID=UPI0028151097|nr:uncharacterized protein LOC132060878 [Lycium ferocissimum]